MARIHPTHNPQGFEENLKAIVTLANEVFSLNKPGGIFCLVETRTGRVLATTPCGDVPEPNLTKYKRFAQEKATRLTVTHREFGHSTSWQSKNEAAEQYGGAIVVGDYIFSFSGYPQLIDQITMLTTAVCTGNLSRAHADRICSESGGVPEFLNLLQEADAAICAKDD